MHAGGLCVTAPSNATPSTHTLPVATVFPHHSTPYLGFNSPPPSPLTTPAASNIGQKLRFVGKEEGKLLAMRQMIAEGIKAPVLVFVQSKERAKVCVVGCCGLLWAGVGLRRLCGLA